MRIAKERTHDRKRKRESMSVRKTEESRARRLANKTKRAEIHAIDPDMKVRVINQIAYDNEGAEIKVENGKIVKWLPARREMIEPADLLDVLEFADEDEISAIAEETGKAIEAQVEKERLGMFSKFTDKFKKK